MFKRGELNERIAVVGLGKLGLPWACVLASAGYNVLGIDNNRHHVSELKAGEYEGREPQVARMLVCAADRLTFTTSYDDIIDTKMAFVVVPTPSDSEDRFSLEYVLPAVASIARLASQCSPDFTLVIVSTVMPGDCRSAISRVVQEAAGSDAVRIHLVYSPEFVALGDVVEGMTSPDLILIGSDDRKAADKVRDVYESIVENNPRRVITSWESAEIAKLAINSFVATKIACANLIGQLCQETSNADVEDVASALGADRRIGASCLTAGLGFGGPCLPRDIRALAVACRMWGIDPALPNAVDSWNRATPAHLAEFVVSLPSTESTVGVLGLTYRVGSSLVESSQALELAQQIAASGSRVVAYDPLIEASDRQQRDWEITLCASPRDVLREATKIVVATPDPAFNWLRPELLVGKTIVDIWRCVSPDLVKLMRRRAAQEGFDFDYVAYGAVSRTSSTSPGFGFATALVSQDIG